MDFSLDNVNAVILNHSLTTVYKALLYRTFYVWSYLDTWAGKSSDSWSEQRY